ncbi:outer membrane lipoprotein chaperone LolA [Veronia pacifica]|uniref:Outer-membrane lipoprotein carrier protein n=1 Tax=Veronia pacifica TaxID=1080227 RepID=A0A1C3EM27_9GAMM|nr:outer membrane lipoprotein chaperone LolA [Veronia pacifica]ODA34275.1 outer membrane lipoprotein carrier protein LolA [Veronia pacifica]
MKKYLLVATLLLPTICFAATPQQELSERLSRVNAFSADFSQTVTSQEGDILKKGKGTLAVKRPNLFNYTPSSDEENMLVSDGKTLWVYDPFVEQTTAMWLNDGTDQTPFVLLTRNDQKDWLNYQVSQKGDRFTLTPIKASTQNALVLDVLPNGEVKGFTVEEQNGPTIEYKLVTFKADTPPANLFQFISPQGADIDDQRQ